MPKKWVLSSPGGKKGKIAPKQDLSGHHSRDWREYLNVIGVISEPFARELI